MDVSLEAVIDIYVFNLDMVSGVTVDVGYVIVRKQSHMLCVVDDDVMNAEWA